MKLSAWYSIGVGTLIILQWVFFLATGSVPEFQTTAELLLVLALLLSGVATLRSRPWGNKALLVALGMAIYSEINSPGYFAQLGQWALVAMFGVLLLGATISVMRILKRKLI